MEVFTVRKATEVTNNAGHNIKKINIMCSDNQAAIKAIVSNVTKSENVLRYGDAVYIQMDNGIRGNEMAKEIAKSAIRLTI